MTVAQLVKAKQAHADAEWTIDEVEIGQVTIVGQVVSIQSQTTNCVYWIDDGSGRIEARHWVDSSSEEDSGKWGGIEENKYVRVTGTLKTFGNKRYINATHIRASTDPHEVYFHILEAINVTLMADRGFSSVPLSAGVSGLDPASAYAGQSSKISDQYSHLPALQQQIVRFIAAQPQSDEGVHVSIIARATGSNGDAQKIRSCASVKCSGYY
ncbi:hypothetical protein H0H87_010799 [Tephrocybe sp. NHM501043]|nr:hypothetical protein H0H87_010799 [Tephrocybe sp. NHM501043]